MVAALPAKNKTMCLDSEGQPVLSTLFQLGMQADMASDLFRLGVQLVIAVLPARNKAVCIDSEGQLALSTLRQLGMPAIMAVVAGGAAAVAGAAPGAKPAAATNRMKERAGAKKRAAGVLASEVSHSHRATGLRHPTVACPLGFGRSPPRLFCVALPGIPWHACFADALRHGKLAGLAG